MSQGNLVRHPSQVSPQQRGTLLGQRGGVVWFTGLPGAGKSSVAARTEALLHASGRATYLLDGDALRLGLSADLGFDAASRRENLRRAGEAAALLCDAGLIVLAAFVSPSLEDRALVASIVGRPRWLEVFVATPVEVCEARDPKGHYARARRGDLPHFTGVSAPYEPPPLPDLRLDGTGTSVEDCAERVVALLDHRGWLQSER